MQNPKHNDAYSIFTDAELVRYARVFNREQIKSFEERALVLDKVVMALAGRLEARLGDGER